MKPGAIVAELRNTALETLHRAIGADEVAAMVDFPNYANVGDSAIYLGQLAALRALNRRPPRFVCDVKTYDRDEMARRLGGGTILLTGGGNFGDLWPDVHRVREDIVQHFPRNRIVQLPQTINFQSDRALEHARAIISRHPDFTLLVRDRRSLEIAREWLGPRCQLCPDMAVCLEGSTRAGNPDRDIIWLTRTDAESNREERETKSEILQTTSDWATEQPTSLMRINRTLSRSLQPGGAFRRSALRLTYEPLARQRLQRGIRMLSRGRVVITDRLHGHILCLILGIPHVLLDDRFGKISGFRDVWTREADGVEWAESPENAFAIARKMVDALIT